MKKVIVKAAHEDISEVIARNTETGKIVITDENGKVLKVGTHTGTENKVEQAYGEQLDINNLLEPAIRKGLLRHGVTFEGEYDDIPVGSFQEAQNIVARGKSMFEALPSAIRTKFENDPGKFINFVQDPQNRPWLEQNGIVKGLDGLDREGKITGYNPSQEIKNEEAAAGAAEAAKNS
jgi:hypothetical protein